MEIRLAKTLASAWRDRAVELTYNLLNEGHRWQRWAR